MSSEDRDEQTTMLQGIWSEIKTVHQSLTKRFDEVDVRLDGMDARFDGVDARFDGMDARLDGMDARLDGVDAHLGLVDSSLRELASQQLDLTRFVKASVERLDAVIEDLKAQGDGWTPPSRN